MVGSGSGIMTESRSGILVGSRSGIMVGSRSGVLAPHMNAILIKVDRTLQFLAKWTGFVVDSLKKIEGMVATKFC